MTNNPVHICLHTDYLSTLPCDIVIILGNLRLSNRVILTRYYIRMLTRSRVR